MSNDQKKNEVIKRVVGEKIQSEMAMISKTFNVIIKNYAFLFDGDMLETQKMLQDAAFTNKQLLVTKAINDEPESEDVIYFDMKTIVDRIPTTIKDQLYDTVFEQFVTKVSLDDIKSAKQEG